MKKKHAKKSGEKKKRSGDVCVCVCSPPPKKKIKKMLIWENQQSGQALELLHSHSMIREKI
jgi:hypothetical protein